ncbi:MAG: hypothetical protein ACTHNW_09110 [Mucilaginibacter sp.]
MEKQVLAELKAIREAISILVGSSHLPKDEQFSQTILDQAAKKYKKLIIEREEWLVDYDLRDIFKGVGYGAGKFLREELCFTQYIVKGKSCYYNRKALIALARELKKRDVDLARYIEYKNDKAKFDAKSKSLASKKLATYILPDDMHNIQNNNPPKPNRNLIVAEIEQLQTEFKELKMGDYIDIHNNHAIYKSDYMLKKYRDDPNRKRYSKWIVSFNCANKALELVM